MYGQLAIGLSRVSARDSYTKAEQSDSGATILVERTWTGLGSLLPLFVAFRG